MLFSVYGLYMMDDDSVKPLVLTAINQLLLHYGLELRFAERTVPRFVDFYCMLSQQ